MNGFYTFWHRFHQLQQKALNYVLINIVFFVGIAPVSLVAKLVGKSFFRQQSRHSTWQVHTPSTRADRLF